MKEKIIIFITGLLLGAVISTGSIYVYTLINNNSNNTATQNMQMPDGGGQMNQNDGTTPPEMPNGNQTGSSNTAA